MKKIELETPIEDMSEADLRETFSDVMAAHEENATAFSELQEEAGKAGEYEEQIDDLQSDVDEAAGYFADKASAITKLDEGVLVDRFSIDELVDLAARADEEAPEFSEEQPEEPEASDDPADEDEQSLFAEKPAKAPTFTKDELDARKEAARSRLSTLGGVSFE